MVNVDVVCAVSILATEVSLFGAERITADNVGHDVLLVPAVVHCVCHHTNPSPSRVIGESLVDASARAQSVGCHPQSRNTCGGAARGRMSPGKRFGANHGRGCDSFARSAQLAGPRAAKRRKSGLGRFDRGLA
jgi:hypothetical protein